MSIGPQIKDIKNNTKRVPILIMIGKKVTRTRRNIEFVGVVYFTPVWALVNVYAVKLKRNTATGTNSSAKNKFHN